MLKSPGREDRFRRIVSADVYAALWRYACRLSGSREDSEDLLQETLARAYERLHQLRDEELARGWLFAIMRRLHLGRVARADSEPRDADDEPAGQAADPRGGAAASELDRAVRAAVAALPAAQREAVALFHFEDLSLRETALTLGVSENNVKQRLWRARQTLLARLEPSLKAGELAELF